MTYYHELPRQSSTNATWPVLCARDNHFWTAPPMNSAGNRAPEPWQHCQCGAYTWQEWQAVKEAPAVQRQRVVANPIESDGIDTTAQPVVE